ncbi:hypothetical protein GCM10007063_05780 [Lentibacillus kapialis]|uniref:Uncharacterized protein n=1 Tax=Lentibacillus kapialis TaxID=340214 RepID=A0A917PPL3_9BACI|nr:hypothetical protein [Lentibacillus kapialis]GGJ86120.1 hypothetical protein GCM10007063_05780 [Lentibacillus kapialis]
MDFYRDSFPLSNYEMGTETLIRALYIGYEVEPEFEEGQWVIAFHDNGRHKCTGVITGIDSGYLTVDVRNVHGEDLHLSLEGYDVIRHATESEIAAEKDRRWWAEHGREVWELKIGDILANKHNGRMYVRGSDVTPDSGHIEVVCFAEQRLDRSDAVRGDNE